MKTFLIITFKLQSIFHQEKWILLFDMLIRSKLNIMGTKAEVRMWVLRDECVWEKFTKTELKREKGAVIYVRDVENNAGGRRQTKVNLLCMLQLNKTPACLSVCLFKGRVPVLPSYRSNGITTSTSFRGGTSSSSCNRKTNLFVEVLVQQLVVDIAVVVVGFLQLQSHEV